MCCPETCMRVLLRLMLKGDGFVFCQERWNFQRVMSEDNRI